MEPVGGGRPCSSTAGTGRLVPALDPACGTQAGVYGLAPVAVAEASTEVHGSGAGPVPAAQAGSEDEAAAALFSEVQSCVERYSFADGAGCSIVGGNDDLRAAVRALERLQRVRVSADLLRRTGMGRALKQLSKAGTPGVSAAAAGAVAAFKRSLLERGEMVARGRDSNVNAQC